MLELQSLRLDNGTNPAGLTQYPENVLAPARRECQCGSGKPLGRGVRGPGGSAAASFVAARKTAATARQATLAKLGRIVFESVLEIYDMNRAYAYWFHFYGFPQPLAEGLS